MRTSILVAIAMAVSAQASVQPFVGTWTEMFGGSIRVRLELRESGGAITGQISQGTTHVDKDGVVDVLIEPASYATPIFDVALKDGVLSFACKDEGETDRFQMRLVGDAAELRFLIRPELAAALARDGMGLPKHARLTRSPR